MKTVLITGASGMLGATLVSEWEKKADIYATGNSDFEGNRAKKYKIFDLKSKNYLPLKDWVTPDYVIHCAALTSHEYCQKNPREAMLVNGESVKKLLDVYDQSKIIFISTDAVFPLNAHLATESTNTDPQTVYGKSKRLGETYLLNRPGHTVRTTIVGLNLNKRKQSFAEWIIANLRSARPIRLYDDVHFTPISVWRLAKELSQILRAQKKLPHTLHIAGSESVTKFDFGLELCKMMGFDQRLIGRGSLESDTSPIKRSKDQTLSVKLYEEKSGRKMPDLSETLKEIYDRVKAR